jgi:hypothetical protein
MNWIVYHQNSHIQALTLNTSEYILWDRTFKEEIKLK